MRRDRNSIALGRRDRLLSRPEEPPLGAHLVTPRLAFAHHGIYVGGGNVVHYGAFAHQFRRVPVEEASLALFAHRHPVFVRFHTVPRFDCGEVIRRARSRLGENRYGLVRNNCEHFCEWCVQGVSRSLQVERVLKLPRGLANALRLAAALIRTHDRISVRARRRPRNRSAQFSNLTFNRQSGIPRQLAPPPLHSPQLAPQA